MKQLIKLLAIAIAVLSLSACSHWYSHDSYQYPNDHEVPAGTQAYYDSKGNVTYSKYKKMDRRPPDVGKKRKGCVTVDGREYCGYDCKVVGGRAKCAQNPKERCVVSTSGQIACGYNCKKTGSSAKCGRYLYDNCATNSYGEIKCGNNCREREDGELVCGK